MTGTVSVAGGETKLGVMPFNQKGNRPRKKPRTPNKANWKELTVWLKPWQKAGKSQYQMANSYMGCESFVFGETGCRIEEAVAVTAGLIIAEQKVPEDRAHEVQGAVEDIFDWWHRTSLQTLAERAVARLNHAIELSVREAHAMTEGAEAELEGALQPAFKMEEGELMVNPSYLPVLEAMTESLEPLSGIDRIYSLLEAESVETESLESAVRKIADAFKFTP